MKALGCIGLNSFVYSLYMKALVRIRVVSPVGRFAGSFRPGSFRPCFWGGSFRLIRRVVSPVSRFARE